MSIAGILLAAAVVGGTGLIIGLFLGAAAEKFYVPVDEKEEQIRAYLPGNNCGGCGFAGCDSLAQAITGGKASPSACPVASSDMTAKMNQIMGISQEEGIRQTAYVICGGTCEKAKEAYHYTGVLDCKTAMSAPAGGPKACTYGCSGFGSCKAACPFQAIDIIDGIAVVNKDKCKACSKCMTACPKHLIKLVPYSTKHIVKCNSKASGKEVKSICSTGCIGCKLCTKVCEFNAITVVDHLGVIDQEKCTACGACVKKCPVQIID